MVNCKSLSFAAVIGGVAAQTAPGFPVTAGDQTLGVTYGTNVVSPPGEQLPRPDVLSPPNITTPASPSTGQAVLLMVDSDVPRNGTRVQLLHWLVSGVTVAEDNLIIPTPGEAEYRPPSPPVGDVPHAYTFLLFEQPEDFSVPEEFSGVLESRVFFDTSAFVAAAGLSEPALAANYILVQNLTGTPTATFPPPRPTNGTNTTTPSTPTSPSEPFPGAAGMVLGGGKAFWAGLGTAIVAGVAAFAL